MSHDTQSRSSLIYNCTHLDEAIERLIDNLDHTNYHKFRQVKFILTENFEDFSLEQFEKLNKKFINSALIVAFVTSDDKRFKILWKTKQIKKFALLNFQKEVSPEDAKNLLEITLKFLENCLKNENVGFHQNDQYLQTQVKLQHLSDYRGFNLLRFAIISGASNIIDLLLQCDISSESAVSNINAQTLAWDNNHQNILLKLLKFNLPFPQSIDISKCEGELKSFIESCLEFHKNIAVQDIDNLEKLIKENPNIQHFFNLSNESALKFALDKRRIRVYELLISNNLHFGQHEDVNEICRNLNLTDREDMYKIHLKYAKELPEKHINTLMLNTRLSHYESDEKGKLNLVLKSYRETNKNPALQVILKIVAAVKLFSIIFDFNADSTYRVDPTTNPSTTGLFDFDGKILIAAKPLLSPMTERETFATIAHELCHFAIHAVFENKANPYPEKNEVAKAEFTKIFEICREKMNFHDVVRNAFVCYSENIQHSELIVRPAHLIALYCETDELKEVSDYYHELFNHFHDVIIPAMEKALPEIESRIVLQPKYIFKNLSKKNQGKIKNAIINYGKKSMKLNEFFPKNSSFYDILSSDHLDDILKGKRLNLINPEFHYIIKLLNFIWECLTEKLKETVKKSNVNFQGEIVKLNIFDENILNYLTPKQIFEILGGQILVIGTKLEINCEIYVDRKFIPEDARLINFEYKYGHDYVYVSPTAKNYMVKTEKDVEFKYFLETFLKQDFKTCSQILYKVEGNSFLKTLVVDLNSEEFTFMHRNSTEIIEIANSEKILILSSEAGAGKTETFKRFTKQIKSNYSQMWVSYVDLKNHTNIFQNKNMSENVENIIKQILNLNSDISEIEIKIFEDAYKSGNVILIWNGFDEISPEYNEFVKKMMLSIKVHTKNFQFICTRPVCSRELSDIFCARTWQLVPFDETNKQDFLKRYLENCSDKNEKILKINETIKKFESYENGNREFNTPLMLKLLVEVYTNIGSYEIYEIYETFVDDKIDICHQRRVNNGSKTRKLITKVIKKFNTIFQRFALLNEIKIFSCSSLNLKIKKLQIIRKKIPSNISIEQISSLGILYFNGQNKFEFVHKTFGEFFVAQYFMENIYDADDFLSDEEAELRLELFFLLIRMFKDSHEPIIDFIHSSLRLRNNQNEAKFYEKFSQLLRTKFKNYFVKLLDINHLETFQFLFDFFKKDHELLVDLLKVHENATLYVEIFNPNNFSIFIDPEEIKNLAQNCLSKEEFQKFLLGKNQKGKILFGMVFYHLNSIKKHSNYFQKDMQAILLSNNSLDLIENAIKNCDNEFLNNILLEFLLNVKNHLTVDEQKELFICALSPKIYLYYEKFFTPTFISKYSKIWDGYEHLLSATEMQSALGTALIHFLEVQAFLRRDFNVYLNFLLEKMTKFLKNDQIYEIFLSENILHEAHWNLEIFKNLWNYLSFHTNQNQRREILLKSDEDDRFFYFCCKVLDKKRIYSNSYYWFTYYDFTPFKIFHRSLLITFTRTLSYTTDIYQSHFSTEELQDMIKGSNDFLFYAIERVDEEKFKIFVDYLEKLFNGKECILKEFLDHKISPTGLTIFEFMEECQEFVFSQCKWFLNLETLSELYDRITTKIESQTPPQK